VKKSPQLLSFNQALAYLQKLGHPLKAHSMRKEVKNFPERFGAMRRNQLAKRGRGGAYFFTKDNLDKYRSLEVV
jgi:hypothetical protein